MRRLYYTILLLSAAAFAGCQREELSSPVQENDVKEVYATTEDMSPTKTYMDGTEVLWNAGDQIVAFIENTLPKRFKITNNSAGSKDARFQLDESYVITGSNVPIPNNVAYYPFNEDVICEPDGASYRLGYLPLPSVQTYAPNSAGNGTYPMVAVTKDTDDVNFRFRNVCGALMLQLQGTGSIKSISIKGNSDEVLCGPVTVTAAYASAPAIALSADGGKTVTLDCGEGVELNSETPTSFIISLPPTSFTNGFSITVTDTWGGTAEYITTKQNPVLRSTILRMPIKEYKAERQPQEGDYIDEYGVNHGQGVKIGETVWAPVNCGYHAEDYKFGKLYQWGRKYGQGYDGELYGEDGNKNGTYSDATFPAIEEGGVSVAIGNHISKANVYFTSKYDYRYDWAYPRSGTLWNTGSESDPVKTEYDPCPDGWRVPSYAELSKLSQKFSSWVSEDGQNGRWFGEAGSDTENVPQIFLPAAGYHYLYDQNASFRNYNGNYWSSKPESGAYSLRFSNEEVAMYAYINGRASAYSVRCVKDDSEVIPVTSIALDKSSLSLEVDERVVLTATITPFNANHKSAYWWSDDESIATVDQNGNVTAVSAGTTIITVMAGMQMATCTVAVSAPATPQEGDYIDEYGINHGQGVKIGETVWAPVNCGYHAEDFKYGKLYQWGRKYGQGYDGYLYDQDGNTSGKYSDNILPAIYTGPVGDTTGQSKDNENRFYTGSAGLIDWSSTHDAELWNAGTEDDPKKTENDPCPDGWRVPTYVELYALSQNNAIWCKDASEQIGMLFDVADASADSDVSQIFLPSAGSRSGDGGGASYRGLRGYYWSSKPYIYSPGPYYIVTYYDAINLYFTSSDVSMRHSVRANGYSVRCVQVTDEVAEL